MASGDNDRLSATDALARRGISTAGFTDNDVRQIHAFGATAPDEETARFAADIYKQRISQSGNFFSSFPRWIIILIAIWFGLLETAEKLPLLMLSIPTYQATLAEAQAKLIQPDLAQAQLTKAQNEAKASDLSLRLATAQAKKAEFEAEAAKYQPDITGAQLTKAKNEALASVYQPDMAKYGLKKAIADATTAQWQPWVSVSQGFLAQAQFVNAAPSDGWHKYMDNTMADLRP
jgi:hypothetical protein